MSLYKKLSTSGLVKTGFGKAKGLFCSASSSGVVQLVDGITGNDDVADKAIATLTSSGAMVPAKHAVTVLTSDATNPANDSTLVFGSRTYTFKTVLTGAANEIKIGDIAADTLDNVKAAFNAGAGAGTVYGTGTVAHADVIATTNSDTQQTFVSRAVGNAAFTTALNALSTVASDAHLSFADTTLGGGTGASDPAVANTAALITINARVYTVVNELSETSGATAVVDRILYGGSEAIMLDNFKLAINAGATAGTNYSTGTVVNADVTAETNTNTTQVIQAIVGGAAGNNITVAESLANHSWGVGVTTLSSGLDANLEIIDEFPIVAGTHYPFSIDEGLDFNTGLYLRLISGTATVTVEYE